MTLPICESCNTELVEDYKGFPLGFLWCDSCQQSKNGKNAKKKQYKTLPDNVIPIKKTV